MLILPMQNKNKKQKNGVNIPSNDSKRIMHDAANLLRLQIKKTG
jgi:hypothetical protein